MFRNLLLLLLSIPTVSIQINAQVKSEQAADCRNIVVQDGDRHSSEDRSSFTIDIDGDGLPDRITPRPHIVKPTRKASSKANRTTHETHWIRFDAKTGKGNVLNSFFNYKYGTEEAAYWAYAFVPCRLKRNGKKALLFYAGDDTSQETIVLVNRGNAIRVYSRKVSRPEL